MAESLSIGGLAHAAGVPITTLRFYERKGLLPPPPRRTSGYRRYDRDAVQRLRFIQAAKALGFSLHEITELLALQVGCGRTCKNVRQHTERKVTDVDARILQLQCFKRALQKLVVQCAAGRTQGACPILEARENQSSVPVPLRQA